MTEQIYAPLTEAQLSDLQMRCLADPALMTPGVIVWQLCEQIQRQATALGKAPACVIDIAGAAKA